VVAAAVVGSAAVAVLGVLELVQDKQSQQELNTR
jgi:hypothetical protein